MKKHKRKSELNKFNLRFWRRLPWAAKKIEIIIIIVAVLCIVVAIFVSIFFSKEAVSKRSLESMAKDYYENYYYDKFVNAVENHDAMMQKYAVVGFAPISLEQLLLFDNRRNASQAETMQKNCDVNSTTIQIFPEEPFGRTDYRVEYNYSCNF